jgi:hypothetical protein
MFPWFPGRIRRFRRSFCRSHPPVSKVDVGLPPHELALQQVHAEEKQRLLGIFPNFYVSYEPNAAPLTAAQKFQLGLRTLIDPEVILGNAIGAGIEQWHNTDRQFGQGMEGYGKRFGADYATSVIHVLIGHTLTQSVFHQDPRYFYKGTGSFGSRFLYAIGTAFVAKGDNGHWQPDYSDMLGRPRRARDLNPLLPQPPPARDCALSMVFCWVSAAGHPLI